MHFANKTRITCANFAEVAGGGEDESDCGEDDGGEGGDGGYGEGGDGGHGGAETPAEPPVESPVESPAPTGGNETASPQPTQPPAAGGSDVPTAAAAVTGVSLLGAVAAALFAL